MVKDVKTVSDIPSIGSVLILGYCDWCESCKQILLDFQNLEESYPSTLFFKEKNMILFQHSHEEESTEFPYVIYKKDGIVEKVFYNVNTRVLKKWLRTN